MKISNIPFFEKTPPILATPPFLGEKSDPSLLPSFSQKLRKLNRPL